MFFFKKKMLPLLYDEKETFIIPAELFQKHFVRACTKKEKLNSSHVDRLKKDFIAKNR